MFKSVNKLSGIALVAALAALPGVANAGTATATGTAVLNVVNQCSVTGASVDLGTFTTAQTWADVAAQLGSTDGGSFTVPSRGYDALNYGSVTCDNGVPYTLTIHGTGSHTGIKLTINGKSMALIPFVKKLGGVGVADNANWPNYGALVEGGYSLSGTGTGTAQSLMGSAPVYFGVSGFNATAADQLGVAGAYADTLSYTLNF